MKGHNVTGRGNGGSGIVSGGRPSGGPVLLQKAPSVAASRCAPMTGVSQVA